MTITQKKYTYALFFTFLFLTYNFVSTAQTALNDSTTTFTNVSKIIDVRANDTYESDYFTGDYCLFIAPQHGTIQVLNQDSIRYVPNFDFTGTDEFVYSLSLDSNPCNVITDTARVVIEVESSGVTLLGRWDVDTLASSGAISYNDIWGHTDCNGHEYAIMGSLDYIHFFDLSDTIEPKEIAAIGGGSRSLWRDMKTYEHRAYAVADQGTEGLLVFDLSTLPTQVTLANQITQDFERSHNIFIDETQGRLYVVGSNTTSNGLIIYDLTQHPDTPALMTQLVLSSFVDGGSGYVHDIYVRDNIAYCSHGFAGLNVYDLNDVQNPILLGSLDGYLEEGYNHASWLSDDGNYMVFADETPGTSLKMTDVSNLGDMSVIDLFKSQNLGPFSGNPIAHNPYIRGNYVIASYYHDGIQIFDMSNPEAVEKVAFYDTQPFNTNYSNSLGAWGVYPFFPSGRIIASDMTHGLMVLQANDINFDTIIRPTYPIVDFLPSDAIALCEGEVLHLEVPPHEHAIYQWSNGEDFLDNNSHQLDIISTGIYSLQATDGHCVALSTPLTVAVDTVPDAGIDIIGSTEICDEERTILQISNPNTNTFSWWKDSTHLEMDTTTLVINESGLYQLIALNGTCQAHSQSVDILYDVSPNVDIEISGNLTFCPDEDLIFEVMEGAENYQWLKNESIIENAVNPVFEPIYSGIYTLIANNQHCVSTSESIEVTAYEMETPMVSLDNNHVLSSTEANAYQWFQNGTPIPDATQQSYIVLESGVYWVETTSIDGCTANSNQTEVTLASVHTIHTKSIDIYPNPTHDVLQIIPQNISNQHFRIDLYDMTGQLILQDTGRFNDDERIYLELSHLPTGVYVLQLLGEQVQLTQRVVVE